MPEPPTTPKSVPTPWPQRLRQRLNAVGLVFENARPWPLEQLWGAVLLVFLAFFFFQASIVCEGPRGYRPFEDLRPYFPWRSGPWFWLYVHRSLLAILLFAGPLLWLFGRRLRGLVLVGVIASVCIHYGVSLSGLPAFDVGNDRSQALDVAVDQLLMLRFPYAERTDSAPITPLTTNIVLGTPGSLWFHRPELMTLVLLPLAFAALAWHRWRVASAFPAELLAVVVFLNPVTVWELMWGSDAMWGAMLLAVALVALDAGAIRGAALLFGLALCSRTSFFTLAPLWGVFLIRGYGWRTGGRFCLIAGAVAVILEVPLMVWDWETFFGYAPVGVSTFLASHSAPWGDNVLGDLMNLALPEGPARAVIVSHLVLLVSLLLGLRPRNPAQLAMATCVQLAVMLLFMGSWFLIDYFCWLLFPLLFAVIGSGGGTAGRFWPEVPPERETVRDL